MAEVKVYRTTYCGYCDMAKRFLAKKNVEFQEIDVTNDSEMRAKLIELTGGKRTVPQIFIDDLAIGGYTDMMALYNSGKLQELLDIE